MTLIPRTWWSDWLPLPLIISLWNSTHKLRRLLILRRKENSVLRITGTPNLPMLKRKPLPNPSHYRREKATSHFQHFWRGKGTFHPLIKEEFFVALESNTLEESNLPPTYFPVRFFVFWVFWCLPLFYPDHKESIKLSERWRLRFHFYVLTRICSSVFLLLSISSFRVLISSRNLSLNESITSSLQL